MKNLLGKLRYCVLGITYAVRNDFSFRVQVVFGVAVVAAVAYFFRPLSEVELLFLFLSWAVVLITELQNTSLETALDRLHPELHDEIGRSKDMAAGAVLIAGLFALFVVLTIAYNHLA